MTTPTAALTTLSDIYDQNAQSILDDFFTFLRFQSVSSEADYAPHMKSCLLWLEKHMQEGGLETQVWETTGHPTLFGQWLGAGPDKPTLLMYGHYDVQPVDPVDLWDSPPFEPTQRGQEIYARGACDNKGQCYYAIQAVRLLLKRDGKLPINVKFVIEGEEEVGSAGLTALLDTKKSELAADYLAIVDVGLMGPDRPAVTLGVRGITTMDVTALGTNGDLHSGSHGGMAYNPIHALTEVLASLRDDQGRINVPGFYDDVQELTAQERAQIDFSFNEADYVKMFNQPPTGGEQEFSPLERQWIRPTVEINGIHGGYTGSGFKTVIPALAHAKVSCRTVPGQDPQKIGRLVKEAIEAKCPPGIKIRVDLHEGSGSALRTSPDSPVVKAFAAAYTEVLGKPCQNILCGGSIPITTELAASAGAQIVLMGFALDDDQIHAPNEHFGIDRLKLGFLTVARTLELLRNQ